jgi:hypothetical protein
VLQLLTKTMAGMADKPVDAASAQPLFLILLIFSQFLLNLLDASIEASL